eukprot:gene5212-5278_t
MGFHIGSDTKVMSGYAHRDFIIGPLNEKNQFHACFIANAMATLRGVVLARGGLFVQSGDWESLKCMIRGLCYQEGGFRVKDPNARAVVQSNPSETGWCLWHKACTKADFEWDALLQRCGTPCWVDSYTSAFPGDPTGVPPGERILGPYHCNKNAIGGFLRGLLILLPNAADELHGWGSKVKPNYVADGDNKWEIDDGQRALDHLSDLITIVRPHEIPRQLNVPGRAE